MRLLLDTHALLWWLADDRRLKEPERHAIADAEAIVHVSAASIWETAIKKNLGRIELDHADLERAMVANDFVELPIRWRHARGVGRLPRHHDDPFDRMLIAQAQTESLVLLSYDEVFRKYDVLLLPSGEPDG